MANIYESMNLMTKLAKARLRFLNQKVQKSGKNIQLEFKYFELEDIVPPAIRIFASMGMVTTTDFSGEAAIMRVHNCDDPEETPLVFKVRYKEAPEIVSNAGKQVTHELQALGSSITYLRRYLWMMVLDITEPDSVDPNLSEEESDKSAKKTKLPATGDERKQAKAKLTEKTPASGEQIDLLKKLCKELRAADEKQDEFVQQIALKTAGFTDIDATACDALCDKLKTILEEYNHGNDQN